jgi:DNA-binding transcriptional MerR regulator
VRPTRLRVTAIRQYDELDLLRPAHVDEWRSHRWYEPSQVRAAVAVRRLRSLRVPLDEVAALIRPSRGSTVDLRVDGRRSLRRRAE